MVRQMILASTVLCVSFCAAGAVYKGDFNGDGKVDLADMMLMYRKDSRHDLNSDGRVDDSDLHYMADLILNDKLVEDSGLSVGIGGWDDGGEDFGGTVGGNAPRYPGRSCSFGIRDFVVDEGTLSCSCNVYFDCGDESVSALMLRMTVPAWTGISDDNFDFTPDESFVSDHKFYGRTVVRKNAESIELRVLLYSPELEPLQQSGVLACLRFAYTGPFQMVFSNCQAGYDEGVLYMPDHSAAVKYVSSSLVEAAAGEAAYNVYSTDGILKYSSVRDIDALPKGIYIVVPEAMPAEAARSRVVILR
ncbi:MAG: hypothetical protein K2G24_00060 [Muribaculaceae bacterium]|nr:hypothetical protein [Muribaculaceae bacterium]